MALYGQQKLGMNMQQQSMQNMQKDSMLFQQQMSSGMMNKVNNSNKFKPGDLTQSDGITSQYQKKMMLKNHNQLKNNYNSVAVPSHIQS